MNLAEGEQKSGIKQKNVVYIGKNKGPVEYAGVIASTFMFSNDGVVVKARGLCIAKAVDAVEIFKRRFGQDIKSDITTSTDELESRPIVGGVEGDKDKVGDSKQLRRVSAIEIRLVKS